MSTLNCTGCRNSVTLHVKGTARCVRCNRAMRVQKPVKEANAKPVQVAPS